MSATPTFPEQLWHLIEGFPRKRSVSLIAYGSELDMDYIEGWFYFDTHDVDQVWAFKSKDCYYRATVHSVYSEVSGAIANQMWRCVVEVSIKEIVTEHWQLEEDEVLLDLYKELYA